MTNALLIKFIILFSLISLFSGCAVHYKNLENLEPVTLSQNHTQEIKFRTVRLPFFSTNNSISAIKDSFSHSKKALTIEEHFGKEIPKSGIFVSVEPLYKAPTIPALAFGYLSISTLTVLPAWSNHDGFVISYRVFNDGELIKTFQYERERFAAVWLGLLPFSWVNFFTTSEYETFLSATNEFLGDLDELLLSMSE